MTNDNKGCAECKNFWNFCDTKMPYELKVNYDRHSRLYKCTNCGLFWDELERFAVIISEGDVQKYYGKEFLNSHHSK